MENDSRDSRERHAVQRDGAKRKRGAADAENEDCRRDAEISRLGEVNFRVHQSTDTDGSNHAVKQNADAAENRRGDCCAERLEFRAESQKSHPAGTEAYDRGRIQMGDSKDARVLAVDRQGRSSDETGESRGNAAGKH